MNVYILLKHQSILQGIGRIVNNKHSGGINIGTSSILVIFVLLSLVTFACLSYLSAQSDYTLSQEAAKRTASYYDANRKAEKYLESIEKSLITYNEASGDEAGYYDGIEKLFSNNGNITVKNTGDRVSISYIVAVTSGQNLEVELNANYPTDSDPAYFHIVKWATATNSEWLEKTTNEGSRESGVKLLFE